MTCELHFYWFYSETVCESTVTGQTEMDYVSLSCFFWDMSLDLITLSKSYT